MYQSGDTRESDGATAMPSGFKYVIGLAALFIAGCSAFFSVRGLGLLFVGSAVAVMIMASSLEVGKLVAASFLYRYWHQISRPLKIYLTIAVIVLIGITSLGNYGYLARAYEKTHTHISLAEQQIAALEKDVADTQRQIDSSRGQLGKASDASREDLAKLQERIAATDGALEQSLARLQERRKTAQDRRDHDLQEPTQRQTEQAEILNKALASEDVAINDLNGRLAVLDRAVDAYTKQGGPGFFKVDSVKKGQELREKQAAERDSIAGQIAEHRKTQEQFRAGHANSIEASTREAAVVREQFTQEMARLDTEEQELRKSRDTGVTQAEQLLAAMQIQGKTTVAGGDTQIESLYQRIRSRNEEIRHLREQIAATDIGSYRFVARAFDASADGVVKWLALALVLVFDPLAVSLAVGFNVALLRDLRGRPASPFASATINTVGTASASTSPAMASRSRAAVLGTTLLLGVLGAGAIAVGGYWGVNAFRHQAQIAHASLIPTDSFAVLSLRPAELKRSAQSEKFTALLGNLAGKTLSDSLTELLNNGFDPQADVYAFAKFPKGRTVENSDQPVILCGLVARVTDAAAAEKALSRMADNLNESLRSASASTSSLTHNRAMIRHGRGKYMDPEGAFFTFAMLDHSAILMVEFEGDPKSPCVEKEIRLCLTRQNGTDGATTDTEDHLPARALSREGTIALWLDAGRFFNSLPKNAAAQARFQQLQQHLGFDLVLKVKAGTGDQLNVMADYAYQNDRFKDRQQPTALQILANLGPAESAGIAGKLMDRCADTLDYDSFIERLRTTLGGDNKKDTEVVVEKSFTSDREAQFMVTAHFNTLPAPTPVAALGGLSLAEHQVQ